MSVFPVTNERALTRLEANRLHTAILEAELQVEALPGWIPDAYIRVMGCPVMVHPSAPGCYSLNLIPRTCQRITEFQAGVSDCSDDTPVKWWYRFTDWWWKW